jgi:Phage tail lysozyme/Ig-like domain from next to BRCA1 gene
MAWPRRSLTLSLFALCLTFTLWGCGDSASPGESVGSGESPDTLSPFAFTNDKAAYEYFFGKGLTNFQAAGIVGNLDQESGASPTAVQSGGPGRGIAQWSVGGRWDTGANDNLTAYASQHGASVWSLQLQLDFIWYELTTFSGYGLARLKQSTNVTDATVVFQTDFEGCGTCIESQRVAYAKAVLAAYGAPPPYAAQFVAQSFPTAATALTMTEGQVIPSYIELKNTGTKTWDSNTRLATTQPRDRKSVFANGTWQSASRPSAVKGTVAPGATYKFTFDLAAPMTAGSHDEFFGVLQEGVAWFSDSGQGGPQDDLLEVKISVVTPDYRGAVKDQSFPLSPAALTVHEGDVPTGTLEVTNTGTKTWKAGTTKLAPLARDKPSPFADTSWLSPTRVSTIAADVPPGAVGIFDLALDAGAVGDTEIAFDLVEESVGWFSDAPADGLLKIHLVVVPKGAPLDAGVAANDGGGVGPTGTGSPIGDNASGDGVGAGPSASCSIGSPRRDTPAWASGLFVLIALGALARRGRAVGAR